MKKTTVEEKNQGEVVGILSSLDSGAIQDVLLERAKRAALMLGVSLLETEAEELCGGRYSRKREELCHRGGSETTSIIVGGGKYRVRRPRVRDDSGEVELSTLKKLKDQDLLDKSMREKMLLGVSTRNYDQVTEGYSEKFGVSKSSVSRAFERASQKDLDLINHGNLEEHSFVGLAIDGIEIAGRCVIAALGITEELEKVPVGLVEGETENGQVVTDLLSSLIERGFSLHCQRLLCLLDGSKALRKGIRSVFGDTAIVQRCWLHKLRNIEAYIPKTHHKTLLWRMKKMMAVNALSDAQRELQSLRSWLQEISDDAARSLDEAGEELLTLHSLGITGDLRKSLSSTNIIESLFSVVRIRIRNVKNYHSKKSNQALRWVAAAVLDHRKNKMRKLRGVNQRFKLIEALGLKLELQKISA